MRLLSFSLVNLVTANGVALEASSAANFQPSDVGAFTFPTLSPVKFFERIELSVVCRETQN